MERIGEAHQVQQGAAAGSFGVVEQAVVAAAAAATAVTKPRAPGLPPTPPASFAAQRGGDVCMEDSNSSRKQAAPVPAHRRSRSDMPFAGYFPPPVQQLLPQPKTEAVVWADAGNGDELFNSYMNLDVMDALNSSSPDSSAKADSSENGDSEEYAADSRVGGWGGAGVNRGAAGAGAGAGHARSLSVDSVMGRLNFATPVGGVANGAGAMFNLEFGAGEFTPAEMKKIMADDKLAEMALADPKRVKRVLANRQSAARSKERKMRYIVELEQKVQILQTEATTLAAQLNILQRDSAAVATQNNELVFRIQSMEQQAQLRDALNDALTNEVQRLKLATMELGHGDSSSSNGMAQHNNIFLQQQATPIPFYQLQHQQQNGTAQQP